MLELLTPVKTVHVIAVAASGFLFMFRGIALQVGRSWAMSAPWRYTSYAIDTVLLAAAIVLVAMLPSGAFGNGWLVVKIVLLVVYIVLGSLALKRARTPRKRLLAFVAALVVFGCMVAIARTHHPLGPWLLLRGIAA